MKNITGETPQQRLKKYIVENYKSGRKFAEAIGMRGDAINKYLGVDGSIIGEKYILPLMDLGFNYLWYVTGRGKMHLSEELKEQEQRDLIRNSQTNRTSTILSEMLNPVNLLNKPDLDNIFDLSDICKFGIDQLPISSIEDLRMRNIIIINRLFDNAVNIRKSYDEGLFNQKSNLDIIERVENLHIDAFRTLTAENMGKAVLQNKKIEILAE